MSEQCNTYVMLGAIFPYEIFTGDDAAHDQLEPFMDSAFDGIHHNSGLCVLFDGMNGKYVAVGRVLAKSANHEGLESHVIVEITDALRSEIKGDILRYIDPIAPLPAFKVTPLVVSHYR